jgi:hypothetical protein
MLTAHDRVKLVNARNLDVDNGCYYPSRVSLVIENGLIAAMNGDPLTDFPLIGKPVQALFMDGKLVINRCGLEVASVSH